ncbi:Phosphate transport system permease protein PstA [Dirofilaria immitis]|nr:Phosphate transport system permease protein PstA [Dirofilaria immitis]
MVVARVLGESSPLLMVGTVAFIADTPVFFSDPATVLPVQIYIWSSSPEITGQQNKINPSKDNSTAMGATIQGHEKQRWLYEKERQNPRKDTIYHKRYCSYSLNFSVFVFDIRLYCSFDSTFV